jgi:hypothetical protein
MKKNILLIIAILFITGQLFAQKNTTITLDLLNPTEPSTFVFINNGYWEHTFNDTDYTWFSSQIFSFSHLIEGPGSAYGGYAWNGFTVCNSGDNANHNGDGNWMNYQWGCMAGGGIMTDAQGEVLKDENGEVMTQKGIPYLVGFWNHLIEPEWWHLGLGGMFLNEPTRCLQILLDDNEEYEAVGVYVNSHPYSYFSCLYGFGIARPLNQEGDFFKLIFHGLNSDGTESGKSVEYFLAKFENGQLTQNDKWEWVDLSTLGEIGGIYCTIQSTDANSYGPKTPVYFCIDKFQVRTQEIITHIPVTDIINVPTVAEVNVPLTIVGAVMPADATNQTIIWSIEDAGNTGATMDGNIFHATDTGTVQIRAKIIDGIGFGENFEKVFTIAVESEEIGINNNELSEILIYPNPTSGELTIMNNEQLTMNSVEVYDVYGRKHLTVLQSYGLTVLNLDIAAFASGVYFLKIHTEQGVVMKKVVKQ